MNEHDRLVDEQRAEAHAEWRRKRIATLNAETAAGMQAELRRLEKESADFAAECGKRGMECALLKGWQADALGLLGELDDYLDQRADYDMEGDPPRFIPNREASLLCDVRDLIQRGGHES